MIRLLRLPQVQAMTGFSRAEIYRLVALGRFPKQVHIGQRAVAWSSSEVEDWVERRVAARDNSTEEFGARPQKAS